jgi:hypothetical protein
MNTFPRIAPSSRIDSWKRRQGSRDAHHDERHRRTPDGFHDRLALLKLEPKLELSIGKPLGDGVGKRLFITVEIMSFQTRRSRIGQNHIVDTGRKRAFAVGGG